MRFVAIEETAIHTAWRPAAEGAPTLVFANSLGTDLRIWDEVVAALPAALGILRYDKRGHGLSQPGEETDRLARHVADLAGLIAEAGIGQHVVVGLSVGGVIAAAYGAARPAGLAGLVLSNTAARVGSAAVWDERIAAVRAHGLAGIAGAVMERWFSPAFRRDETVALAGLSTMLTRQDAEGYIAICRMLREADLRESVGTIEVPTLCIAGTADLSTPPAVVEDTAGRISGAAFASIEGVGHIPCVEVPADYAARLLTFLQANALLPR
ncbi:MAG: 3-oxoadipate enol-lactonase [Acuticoccus sp.]